MENQLASELECTKAKLAAALDAFPDQYFELNGEGVVLHYHAGEGCTPLKDVEGRKLAVALPPDMAQEFVIALKRAKRTRATVSFEFAIPDSRIFQGKIVPFIDEHYLGILRDVTDQRRAEQDFRGAQGRYRELLENANDCVYTHDLRGDLTSMNRAAEIITGYTRDDILNMNICHVVAPEYLELAKSMIERKLGGGGPTVYDLAIISKDGRRRLLEVSTRLLFRDGAPAAVQGIARDITERRRMEEQLRQSQKLEAIGVLAGGVAHDFNNLLTGILGYTSLLKAEALPPERVGEAIDVIQRAAERAAELTSQLLGFARRGKHQNVAVDLHDTLREVVGLLQRTIDKNIRLSCAFNTNHSRILGDPGQMQQVFLNLALNARDSMPIGGELVFRTDIVDVGINGLDLDPSLPPGAYVRIAVSDTGVGIREDIRDRIFEPFFTTKEPSKGTGMGLAMVYGIVKNHGGVIQVESEVGKGSVFSLYFPLEPSAVTAHEPSQEAPRVGQGRILVVDDEEVVRKVASSMLRNLGYEVVAQPGAREAIDYFRDHHSQIDLVLLDVVMPIMGGKECLAALRAINPSIRAILSSGYGHDSESPETAETEAAFIEKPYRLTEFARKIAFALSSNAA